MWAVEREAARGDLWQADPALPAREVLGIQPLLAVARRDQHRAAAQAQRGLHGIRDTGGVRVPVRLLTAFGHREAVDYHLDAVVLVLVQLEVGADVVDLAVHPHPDIAGLSYFLEDAEVLALAVPHQWGEDHEPGAGLQRQHGVHDLLDRLLLDGAAAVRTERPSHARVEET